MKPFHYCLITTFLACVPLTAGPLIIGHRGGSGVAPENTVASFKEALDQGADGFELDIWLTKDGRAVVLHDKSAKRTTGQDLVVQEHDLAEFQKLDAGSWKGEKWKGEPIPSLEEALAALPAGKTIFIEIKCGPSILPELKRVVEASGKSKDQIVIISFDYETLVQAKPLLPDHKILWIVGGKENKETKERTYPELAGLVEKAASAEFAGLDLDEGFPLDAAAVAGIKAKGLELGVWTVNNSANGKRLAIAGVDAITTNEPAQIRKAIREK